MTLGLPQVCALAISHSLFQPTTLQSAIDRLGFIQADPIRSPARAQDLILRHRVRDYRAGDLERRYPSLDIEEDLLYAYGFLSREVYRLVHPRITTGLPDLEQRVLASVRTHGPMHPVELDEQFGRERIVNAWGGYSKATKRALEHLHYRGFLRIARRENGIRIYEAAAPVDESIAPEERLRKLLLVIANVLAPVPDKTLQAIAARVRRVTTGVMDHRKAIRELLDTGELETQPVAGLTYIWPASTMMREAPPARVRFLAPFDPLVWDRRRFEHLWEWPYRFEAYTPPAKRLRGYYAMPLLWRERVIGWANANVTGQQLDVELGFVGARPRDRRFDREVEVEISRLRTFLELDSVGRSARGPAASTPPRLT
ncbi:MAG: DNA glycosylase AlkZ-like family protein [Egibacteraceae bacterium]